MESWQRSLFRLCIGRARIARRLAQFGQQAVDLLLNGQDTALAAERHLLPAPQFVKLLVQRRGRLCPGTRGDGVFHQVQRRQSGEALSFEGGGMLAFAPLFAFTNVGLGLFALGDVDECNNYLNTLLSG
jgi:hypothetical protein